MIWPLIEKLFGPSPEVAELRERIALLEVEPPREYSREEQKNLRLLAGLRVQQAIHAYRKATQ